MSLRATAILLLFVGCAGSEDPEGMDPAPMEIPASLAAARVYFGHQSVGRNVLEGIAEVAPALAVLHADDAAPPGAPGLIESAVGANGDPPGKDRAFLDTVRRLENLDLALYKYCYVDLDTSTDPGQLFRSYARTLDAARAGGVPVAAVTMPVTSLAPAWKRWTKRLLGRTTALELNAARARFNALVRERFGDRLVDLARMESTLEDGTRCTTGHSNSMVEFLPPAFTDDGAHLNARGRAHVARQFLAELARITAAGS